MYVKSILYAFLTCGQQLLVFMVEAAAWDAKLN